MKNQAAEEWREWMEWQIATLRLKRLRYSHSPEVCANIDYWVNDLETTLRAFDENQIRTAASEMD